MQENDQIIRELRDEVNSHPFAHFPVIRIEYFVTFFSCSLGFKAKCLLTFIYANEYYQSCITCR